MKVVHSRRDMADLLNYCEVGPGKWEVSVDNKLCQWNIRTLRHCVISRYDGLWWLTASVEQGPEDEFKTFDEVESYKNWADAARKADDFLRGRIDSILKDAELVF